MAKKVDRGKDNAWGHTEFLHRDATRWKVERAEQRSSNSISNQREYTANSISHQGYSFNRFLLQPGVPRSLVKHSKACWITLQTALSYLCAIKIEFNLNIHPLKVTAILLKVKILLNSSKSFLKRFNLACKSFRAVWYQYIALLH